MEATCSKIIHPGGSAASLTFTHLELLTHEEYAPWKRMWFNHITARSVGLSHASRLLVSKWITDLINQGQFACWHDWINSLNKQQQVVHRASAREVPLCGQVTGGIFRVLMRNQNLCHCHEDREIRAPSCLFTHFCCALPHISPQADNHIWFVGAGEV